MPKHPDPIKTATQAVELALRAGADAADAYLRTAATLSLQVRGGEIDAITRATTMGLGLRVMVDGRTALVHSTNTAGIAFLKLIERAVELARALPKPDEQTRFAQPGEVTDLPHSDPDLATEPTEAKTARLIEMERAMLAVPGVVRSTEVAWQESDGEIALVNSNGVSLYAPFSTIEINGEALAERDGETFTGGRSVSSSSRQGLLDPSTLGREAGERAAQLLGARPVKSCKVPVIFTPFNGWTLLACLSQPLRGDRVTQGRSYLAQQMGQSLAAPGVTIVDDPLLPQGAARHAFDGEGSPCRRQVLVERGNLKAYLTDLASAEKLGVVAGGNAHRDAYNAEPDITSSNLVMEAGAQSPAEIIAATSRGLMLHTLSGWWVGMSSVLDAYSSAAMGFWIENGEVVHPVKGITIAGSLREMLRSIDMIGNDLAITHRTSVPTFRVAEMAVSGL